MGAPEPQPRELPSLIIIRNQNCLSSFRALRYKTENGQEPGNRTPLQEDEKVMSSLAGKLQGQKTRGECVGLEQPSSRRSVSGLVHQRHPAKHAHVFFWEDSTVDPSNVEIDPHTQTCSAFQAFECFACSRISSTPFLRSRSATCPNNTPEPCPEPNPRFDPNHAPNNARREGFRHKSCNLLGRLATGRGRNCDLSLRVLLCCCGFRSVRPCF